MVFSTERRVESFPHTEMEEGFSMPLGRRRLRAFPELFPAAWLPSAQSSSPVKETDLGSAHASFPPATHSQTGIRISRSNLRRRSEEMQSSIGCFGLFRNPGARGEKFS